MIHFIPDSATGATELNDAHASTPYAEAVARLASIRQALACVEQVAGEAPSPRDSEARLAVRWPGATSAAKRVFNARSARSAAGAAAGLEAIAARHDQGQAANPAATEKLAAELAAGLDELDILFSL